MSKNKFKAVSTRTSPRNPNVEFNRLKIINKVVKAGYNYNKSTYRVYCKDHHKRKIYPARRLANYYLIKYIQKNLPNKLDEMDRKIINYFNKGGSLHKYLQGWQPKSNGKYTEIESRIRNAGSTGRKLGLFDPDNSKFTPMGKILLSGHFDQDDLIRQLVRRFIVLRGQRDGVFPFQTFLYMMKNNGNHLSMMELTFMFGATTEPQIKKASKAVKKFRKWYQPLKHKKANSDLIDKKIIDIWNLAYPNDQLPKRKKDNRSKNKKFSRVNQEYPDAFKNTLLRTNIFTLKGLGDFKAIHYIHANSIQYHLLLKYNFTKNLQALKASKQKYGHNSLASSKNIEWYGNNKFLLPWEDKRHTYQIIKKYLTTLRKKRYDKDFINKYAKQAKINQNYFFALKRIKQILAKAIAKVAISYYDKFTCRQYGERKNILKAFKRINDNKSVDSVAPSLALENISWKAFMSMGDQSYQKVHYPGKTDFNLHALSDAPGGYPDMVTTFGRTKLRAIIGEVSKMSSTRQYEHEGSSVSYHTIEYIKQHPNQHAICLFLDQSITNSTWRMFYSMNWASWDTNNTPAPIIPFTIEQFIDILNFIYKNHLTISAFYVLLSTIHHQAYLDNKNLKFFNTWKQQVPKIINNWKAKND